MTNAKLENIIVTKFVFDICADYIWVVLICTSYVYCIHITLCNAHCIDVCRTLSDVVVANAYRDNQYIQAYAYNRHEWLTKCQQCRITIL